MAMDILKDLWPMSHYDVETSAPLGEERLMGIPFACDLYKGSGPVGVIRLFKWPVTEGDPNPSATMADTPVYWRSGLNVLPPTSVDWDELMRTPIVVTHEAVAQSLHDRGYGGDVFVPDVSLLGAHYDREGMFRGTTRLFWFQKSGRGLPGALFQPLWEVAPELRKRIPSSYLRREHEILSDFNQRPDIPSLPPGDMTVCTQMGVMNLLNLTGRHIRFVDPANPSVSMGDLPPFGDESLTYYHQSSLFSGFLSLNGHYLPVFERMGCWPSARLARLLSSQERPLALVVTDELAVCLASSYRGPIYTLGPEHPVCHPSRPSFVSVLGMFKWQ